MSGQFFSLSRYNLSQWKLGRLLPGPHQLISPCRPCPLVQVHSSLWQHLAFSVCSREYNNRLRALSRGPHNLSRLDNCPRAIFYWNPVESAVCPPYRRVVPNKTQCWCLLRGGSKLIYIFSSARSSRSHNLLSWVRPFSLSFPRALNLNLSGSGLS